VHESGHCHTVLDLLVDDVWPPSTTTPASSPWRGRAQDVGQDLEGDVLREARHVERRLRLAPHGVDVGERVGGRDRPELEGVVDDRREKSTVCTSRQVGRDTEHPGVVGGEVRPAGRVHHRRERAEDLRQVRRTQLAGQPAARARVVNRKSSGRVRAPLSPSAMEAR